MPTSREAGRPGQQNPGETRALVFGPVLVIDAPTELESGAAINFTHSARGATMDTLELVAFVGLVGSGFVATNLDNLVILVVLLGSAPGRSAAILLGYLVSAICVIVLATLGVLLGALVNPSFIGYLGLLPVSLGAWQLYQHRRGRSAAVLPARDPTVGSEGQTWMGSFLLMFTNSGDTVALFLPLLAESSRMAALWVVSLFLLLALAWAMLSRVIAGEPRLARQIEARSAWLVPWIMIAVGCYVLLDTGTDTLL
jgi:cadmium resistance protein CadD (predicted permease)